MKQRIKKYIASFVMVCLLITNMPSNILASERFISEDELLAIINDDIDTLYGRTNYYKESISLKGNTLALNRDFLKAGVPYANAIEKEGIGGIDQDTYRKFRLPYGNRFTISSHKQEGEEEYYGYSPEGSLVENPNYHWNSWDGELIENRTYVKEPWRYTEKVSVRQVSGGYSNSKRDITYTCPNGEKKTLAAAIQTGMDIRYGDKPASDAVYRSSSKSIVYNKGERPSQGGEWIEYVDIVQPPTYYSWGQGYLYFDNGTRYMGVDIAPYCLVASDLSIKFDGPLPGKTKNGEEVEIVAHSNSNFKKDIATCYRWTVVGATTGTKVQDGEYKLYDEAVSYNGECTIPAPNKQALFKVKFTMPEEPVVVTLEINYKAPYVDEGDYENNKITYKVEWQPYIKTETDYILEYDELTKQVEGPIAKSGSSASISLPKGSWNGEASGALNVSIDNSESAINGAMVKEGTNDPVSGEVTSATRNPVLTGTIIRSDFGDDPDDYYASNSKDPVVKSLKTSFEGMMQRPWIYTYYTSESYTGSDGKTHSRDVKHEDTGTSTGEFVPGENLITVTARIYNGRENMPHVVAREFKKEIDNNTHTSLAKTIWWESDEYHMLVQRWMKHVFLTEPEEYEAIKGQYERIFTQQNKATIKWGISKSMSSIYEEDLNNAKRKSTNKSDYPHVPFATDRDLQRQYKYPFKSGYYFNPVGEYTLTIHTEIYKNEDKETQEHKELVDKVLQSFNYGSNMTYVDKRSQYQLKLEIDDPTAELAADDLLGIKRDYTKEISYELEHSPDSIGSTHPYFKEILEGYDESNTLNSKINYKYKEYIQDGQHIYKVIEETLITITVNPSNKKCYTFGGMKNGKYYMTAWLNDVDVSSITNVPGMTLKGVNTEKQLDEIALQVHGSMYDDLNN